MSWPLFLLAVWGLSATASWSKLCGPPRLALVELLKRLEAPVVRTAWWKAHAPLGGDWVSSGPRCPACVAFWVAWALDVAGAGPQPGLGGGGLLVAFAAYGVVFAAAASVERLTAGLDF